jgi:hypothetical protein
MCLAAPVGGAPSLLPCVAWWDVIAGHDSGLRWLLGVQAAQHSTA